MSPEEPFQLAEGFLRCLVCGEFVKKGEWYIPAGRAPAPGVISGTPFYGERPVHITCLLPPGTKIASVGG